MYILLYKSVVIIDGISTSWDGEEQQICVSDQTGGHTKQLVVMHIDNLIFSSTVVMVQENQVADGCWKH